MQLAQENHDNVSVKETESHQLAFIQLGKDFKRSIFQEYEKREPIRFS